jgi:uroporphyrinogen III methyltransferase/synthase
VSARVYLVGAGPGDPGLLTARALELIAAADVILYDRLIPEGALDGARAGAELVFVGKRPAAGGTLTPQGDIERLLLLHAREDRTVVRLKGGDPFVFGRGGEEAEALQAAGIAFEVVPGVTAGVAAPAYAGIPVTHRDHASAVAFVTGHEDPDKPDSALRWDALAAFPGTLVFYMGMRRLPDIIAALTAAGRDGGEPAAVVAHGTLPEQQVVTGTLHTIAERALAAGVSAPAVTVIGPVAGLRATLAWFEARPLHGRTVAVTRARAQASGLAARLRELGAAVVEAPSIRIEPLRPAIPDLGPYDLVCLTSPNGVRLLFDGLASDERDARALADATVAAIGPGTARELRAHGVVADVVAERAVAEALVEALRDVPVTRALVARAREAREVLPDALRARGADVEVLALYETVAEPLAAPELAAAQAADYVVFTSSSTVRFFLAAATGTPELSDTTRVVSIGPVTTETLRQAGLTPHVEATRHDIDGVIEALLGDASARAPTAGAAPG